MNTKMIIILAVIGVVIGIAVVKNNPTGESISEEAMTTSSVKLISPEEFKEMAQDKNAFILDVHTPKQSHIPGTDALIPFNEIGSNISSLPEDKDTPILVYCRSGSMSEQASAELVTFGYTNVYDLDGGTNAYKGVSDEVVITPDTQDFGTVIYGDVPRVDFTFTNYTDVPVNITRVSTSCGCTTAEVENKNLEAYSSTTVEVAFNPAIHGDDTDLGELTRTVFIETDHPDFPKLSADITANVIKE